MKKNVIRWAGKVMVPVLAAAMAVPMITGLFGQTEVRADVRAKLDKYSFPDANFREYLRDNFDVNPKDGFLSEEEMAAVTKIVVPDMGITDLTGIRYFPSLKTLDCRKNEIEKLNLESNTAITYLNCSENKIEQLDLEKNTALTTLDCSDNNISQLNIQNLQKLRILYCYNNKLTELTLSGFTELRELSCHDNQLESLLLSDCTKLYDLNCANNQISGQLKLQDNIALEEVMCQGNRIEAFTFPDQTKLTTLNCADNWVCDIDLNDSPNLSFLNCSMNRLVELDVSPYVNLHYLYCHTNSIQTLNLSACTKLLEVDCSKNYISTQPSVPSGCALIYSPQDTYTQNSLRVDRTHFPDVAFRQFITLNIDNNPCDGWLSEKEINAVYEINCSDCGIVSLRGIEYFKSLKTLNCTSNKIVYLDLLSNKNLILINCSKNPTLSRLNVWDLHDLWDLRFEECNLSTLDISTNENLNYIFASDNRLKNLDLSSNLKLISLEICNNNLTSLDVSKNTALHSLYCTNNSIPILDVTNCTKLTSLHCDYNYLEKVTGVPKGCTSLTIEPQKTVPPVTGLSGYAISEREVHLEWDQIDGVSGYEIEVKNTSGTRHVRVKDPYATEQNIEPLAKNVEYYFKIRSYLTIGKETRYSEYSEVVTIRTPVDLNETNFPDKEFRRYAEYKDKDQDGLLTREELDAVTELMIGDCDIADLTGIEYFDKLEELYCAKNKLTTIDLRKNTELRKFNCSLNPDLTVLILGSNEKLYYVNCSGCNLSALDVSQNPALMGLDCSINHLTELNLRKNPNLITLNCSENDLTSLDLCNNERMTDLDIYGNRIDKVDIHHMPYMMEGVMYEGDPELHVIETYYIDASGVKHYIYEAGAESAHVCFDKTTKLIIKELAKCTVTFDANGGSGSVKALTVMEGDSFNLPINGFTAPAGKEFDKWSAGIPGETIVVTADMTIKAIWKDVPVTPKPTGTTPKPTGTTPKPTGTTPKPTGTTPKPTGATPKPTGATPKPTGATPKPTGATPKPTGATPKPTGATPKPTGATPKPTGATPKPTGATPKPTGVTPKPDDPTPTPDPEKEPSIADFVERLYTIALARESEPEGKAFWVNEIESGNRTGGDCAHFFLIEAQEFLNRGLTDEDFVETLYLTFFDRASEPAGKKFWVDSLKNGTMTKENVINGFIDSTEWCNVCATYGVKSGAPNAKAEFASKNAIKFATRLYTCCLGRDPEEGGLRYWSLALTNLEQTGYAAAEQFFTGAEFVNLKTTDEEYVKRLYTTFMGRDPEAGEIAFWTGELAKGTQTRTSTMQFFGHSEEFTNICKQYGIDRG